MAPEQHDQQAPVSSSAGHERKLWDYGQLPLPGKDWTRLVRLYRGTRDSYDCISLELCQLPSTVDFVALSYCWGSSNLDHRLHIVHNDEDYELNITANLHDTISLIRAHMLERHDQVDRPPHKAPGIQALQTFLKAPSVLLWIDAVCIDQANDCEKVDQIRLMPSIFPASKFTLAQLGPDGDITESDLRLLHKVGSQRLYRARQLPGSTLFANEDESRDHEHASTIVAKIFSRDWFQRAWCLQESITRHGNEPVIFMLGRYTLTYWLIFGAHVGLHPTHTPKLFLERASAGRQIAAMNMLLLTQAQPEDIRLSTLLCVAAGRTATIPRDKIYALLGILPDTNGLPQPDYLLDDDEVCISFTRSMIEQEGRLFVMQCLDKTNRRHESPTSLPTWCISVHHDCHFSGFEEAKLDTGVATEFANAASASSRPMLLVGQTLYDKVLHLRGQKLDQVLRIVHGDNLDFSEWHQAPSWQAMRRTLLELYEVLNQTRAADSFGSASMKDMLDIVQGGMLELKDFEAGTARYPPYQTYTDRYRTYLAHNNIEHIAPGPASQSTFRQWCEHLLYHDTAQLSTLSDLQELGVPLDWLQEVMVHHMLQERRGWTFFKTAAGRLGAAGCRTRHGDRIFLVPGSSTPMVMREVPDIANAWYYRGEAYVPGIMQGEAYDPSQLEDMHIH